MPGKAAKVVITERQQDILRQLSRSVTIAFQLRQRAQIILLGFEGRLNSEIEDLVGLGHDAVGRWRRRWQQEFERLTLVEGLEETADLRRAIEEVLSDEPRSGRPCEFTAEQLTMIFAVACEAVEESGRPVARWTQCEIIDEVVKRGIVKSISTSHLSTLLAEAQLQPHKSRYWLNTKEADPEVFREQVRTVCDCYRQAPELLAQFDTHTVCIDEMTGIQALEQIAPKKRCGPARKSGSSSNTSGTARSV
jgi:transposase